MVKGASASRKRRKTETEEAAQSIDQDVGIEEPAGDEEQSTAKLVTEKKSDISKGPARGPSGGDHEMTADATQDKEELPALLKEVEALRTQHDALKRENEELRKRTMDLEEEYEPDSSQIPDCHIEDEEEAVIRLNRRISSAERALSDAQESKAQLMDKVSKEHDAQVAAILLDEATAAIAKGEVERVSSEGPSTELDNFIDVLTREQDAKEECDAARAAEEEAKQSWNHSWWKAARTERLAVKVSERVRRLHNVISSGLAAAQRVACDASKAAREDLSASSNPGRRKEGSSAAEKEGAVRNPPDELPPTTRAGGA